MSTRNPCPVFYSDTDAAVAFSLLFLFHPSVRRPQSNRGVFFFLNSKLVQFNLNLKSKLMIGSKLSNLWHCYNAGISQRWLATKHPVTGIQQLNSCSTSGKGMPICCLSVNLSLQLSLRLSLSISLCSPRRWRMLLDITTQYGNAFPCRSDGTTVPSEFGCIVSHTVCAPIREEGETLLYIYLEKRERDRERWGGILHFNYTKLQRGK